MEFVFFFICLSDSIFIFFHIFFLTAQTAEEKNSLEGRGIDEKNRKMQNKYNKKELFIKCIVNNKLSKK